MNNNIIIILCMCIIVLMSLEQSNAEQKKVDIKSDTYKDYIAKQRAAAHPKGSGIGTNKYNVDYNSDYLVDKYIRKD
jgi:hypothetical protein